MSTMRETAKTAEDENGIAKAQAAGDGKLTDAVAGRSIDYLKRFGYLAEDTALDSPAQDTVLDSPMGREAVRAFQAMALLPESGEIDEATLAAFARPRCGVSDGIGLKVRTASSNFEAFGTVWNHAIITHRINNFSPDLAQARQRTVIANAWQRWASIVPLVFREVTSTPDIEIRFARGDHGDTLDGGSPFDGVGGVLAHAFRPPPPDSRGIAGDVHFDDDETWQEGFSATGGLDLLTVAVHEFGHSLGLNHTSVPGSTMNPFYPTPSVPATDDRAGIKSVYQRHIWVASLYRDVLGRRFDDTGLDSAVRGLFGGITAQNLARQFCYSKELSDRLVTDLYFMLLNRQPDPGGLATWSRELQRGMGRQTAIMNFVDSAEYRRQYPSDTAFITSLYQRLLNRAPEASGLQVMLQSMQAGTSRYEIARGFLRSEEYCRAYMRGIYNRYLRRDPDAEGWTNWTNRLKSGLNQQDAIVGAVSSTEYQNAVIAWW
jgi:hypothetical protein